MGKVGARGLGWLKGKSFGVEQAHSNFLKGDSQQKTVAHKTFPGHLKIKLRVPGDHLETFQADLHWEIRILMAFGSRMSLLAAGWVFQDTNSLTLKNCTWGFERRSTWRGYSKATG